VGGTRKLGAKILVLGWIAGVDDVLTSRPKSWRSAAVSLRSAASIVAWMASWAVANVR